MNNKGNGIPKYEIGEEVYLFNNDYNDLCTIRQIEAVINFMGEPGAKYILDSVNFKGKTYREVQEYHIHPVVRVADTLGNNLYVGFEMGDRIYMPYTKEELTNQFNDPTLDAIRYSEVNNVRMIYGERAGIYWYDEFFKKWNNPKEKYSVYFNDEKGTTVLKEGDKITKVKVHDDTYDKRFGFLLAYFQHTCGLSKTQANKYLKEVCDE